MGASDSKLNFRKAIVQLANKNQVNTEEFAMKNLTLKSIKISCICLIILLNFLDYIW